MAKIYHLNCPNCGGLISSAGERVVECKYCHSRSLALIPDWMPRHYLEPRLDFQQARRAMVNLFQRDDVEAGLLSSARFESAELFFAPFYLLRAKRVGVFTSFAKGLQPQSLGEGVIRGNETYSQYIRRQQRQERQLEQQQTDSRVIMADVERSFPAVNFDGWGLEEFEPDKVMVSEGAELKQYRREEVDRLGTVLEPKVSVAERVEIFFKTPELAFVENRTELVEQRMDLIYYPVWRVRWRYRGKACSTTIDGVTGKILYARAPAKERARVIWLLAVSAAVGLSVGKLLKIPFLLLFATGVVSIWIILLFATGLLFFVAMGWNMLRYSSELVISGENAMVEFIGRPAETVFDKMAKGLSGFVGGAMQQAARARNSSNWN